jgi:hypothetical protein
MYVYILTHTIAYGWPAIICTLYRLGLVSIREPVPTRACVNHGVAGQLGKSVPDVRGVVFASY